MLYPLSYEGPMVLPYLVPIPRLPGGKGARTFQSASSTGTTGIFLVRSPGFEPGSPAPQADTLSLELRAHGLPVECILHSTDVAYRNSVNANPY